LQISGVRQWREHPNPHVDVLAIDVTKLIVEEPEIEKKFARYEDFATPDILKNEDITVGEDIMVIGHPLGIAHARSNSPLVRQGIIATRIGEHIHLNVEGTGGRRNVEIPGFLIDAAIVGGSSGSPVVLKPVIGRAVKNNINLGAARPYLLGIVSGMRIAPIKVGGNVYPTLAGLGIVYDAATIRETIELFFR
jgi:hypothetical protein